MKPEIIEDLCTMCEECIIHCDKEVFSLSRDDTIEVSMPKNCIGCRQCIDHCPNNAIELID